MPTHRDERIVVTPATTNAALPSNSNVDGFTQVRRRRRHRSKILEGGTTVPETEKDSPPSQQEQIDDTHSSLDTCVEHPNMNADLEINADLPERSANYRSRRENERSHMIHNQSKQIAKLREQNKKLMRRLTNKGRRRDHPEGDFSEMYSEFNKILSPEPPKMSRDHPEGGITKMNPDEGIVFFKKLPKVSRDYNDDQPFILSDQAYDEHAKMPTYRSFLDYQEGDPTKMDSSLGITFGPKPPIDDSVQSLLNSECLQNDALIDELRLEFMDAQSAFDEFTHLTYAQRYEIYKERFKAFWSEENRERIKLQLKGQWSCLQKEINRAVGVSYKDLDHIYAPIMDSFKDKKEMMYQICIRVIMYCVALQSCRTAKDVIMTTIGVCGQHLTYEHISSLLEFAYPEGIFDDFSNKLSKFRSMALCIEEVPCYDMLKKGLSLCVFFGMKPANMIVSNETMRKYVKKFEKDVVKNFGTFRLVDAVLSLGDYAANAISCIRSGGNLTKFLLPSDLHSRYADIMATFTLVENGTFQKETSDNLDSFERLVRELSKEVEISLSGNGLTPHFKTVYTEYLKNLKNMLNKLHIIKQNATYRIKPYCVSFFGKSQIGKSMATNMLIRAYGAVSGKAVDTREVYYHSEAAKHQTGFTNDKRVYVLDDMDTIRRDTASYVEAMIAAIIHNVNNVPSMINHADISQKGVNFERNELTVLTTNCLDLDIHEKIVYGPAVANRIHFVEVILDPKHATQDGTLDYSTLSYEDGVPHPHHFIQRYNIVFTFDTKTQKPVSWHREEIGPRIPFAQWLRETALDMKKHYEHQKFYLKEMEAIQNVQCCDKCWMPLKGGYCVCPPAIVTTVPEADRYLEQFFANPKISAVMGYFNVWENVIAPIGNHFVEQLVLKTTLFLTVVIFRALKGMQVDASPYYFITLLFLWMLRENLYLFANPITLCLIAFSLTVWLGLATRGLLKLYKAHIRKEIHEAAVGQATYLTSILGITSLCTAAAAIKVIQSLMANSSPEGNLAPKSMEEVKVRNDEKNEWLVPSRSPVPAPVQLSTMTRDQVLAKLKNNCIYFTAVSNTGVQYSRGTAWLVDACHVMLPHHTYEMMQKETPSPYCVTLYRGNDTRQSSVTYLTNPAPVKCSREGTLKDFVVFQSTKSFPVQSILKYLPIANPSEVVCEMMTVNENLVYSTQTVKYAPLNGMTNGASCVGTRISQRGSRHKLQVPTKAGDCLAPLVSHVNPHYIVGFHIGAREEPLRAKQGIAFELLQGELQDAITRTRGTFVTDNPEEKPADWPEGGDQLIYQPTASLEEVRLYDCEGRIAFHVGDFHERSNARYISADPSMAIPSVDFYGEDPSQRHRTFSSVSRTFLSPYLEDAGSRCKWRPPNFQSNRNHATYLEIGIRPMRDIDPVLLNRAQIDYLSVVHGLIERTKWPKCGPIPLNEALNGREGSRFIHSIKDDTSGGFGFKGRKHRHMETWYRDSDGKKMFTPLPHLCSEVERIMTTLAKGQMSCPIVKTALKDEPTLSPEFNNGKDKVRIFSVYPMDFFLVGKMLFAPVLEFLQSFPLELELYQGINVTTDEWEQVAAHILDFEPDSIIEGDFSKMDVRLSGQIIRASGACLIEMAYQLGYDSVSLRQMESYICDIALSSWSYSGLLMMLDGWNTSGNLLTIVINGTALALLHRTAYLSHGASMRPSGGIPPFRDVIRMGFVGDDSLGSSKLPWYNMKFLQEYFGSVGMVYTDGRKSLNVPCFTNALEASLCKRRFRYEPRVAMRVAPIELDSLYKSLHCMMKSNTEETTIVTGNVDQALRELSRHSEEDFTREREIILQACERAGILHLIKYSTRTYDDWWQVLSDKLPVVQEDEYEEYVEDDSAPRPQVHRFVTSRIRVERVAPSSFDSNRSICLIVARLCWTLIWLFIFLRTFSAQVPAQYSISATEFKDMNMGSETQKEVMSFGDQQSHWVVGMNTEEEKTVYAGSTNDTNDGFLFRPMKIYSAQWSPGASLFDTIDPWSLFFEDPRVINRVAHFRNMRTSLKLKFLINGNPFYYGRILCAYQPLPEVDGVTVFREGVVQDFVEASQRLHVMLNPTLSEGGEMTLPFIYPKNYAVIPEREWNKLGRLTLASFNTLRHANASTKPVTITVLAYCEPDLDLSLPTAILPADVTPQGFEYPEGDEYGMVSSVAHTVANVSGKLSNVPVIGKFARATEIASSAVGGIASLFGFSRPRVVDENRVTVVRMHGTTAVTNEPDSARTLALDGKKEVTIDPRVTNAPTTDEMAIVPLAKRESFLTQFTWDKSDGQDTSLFQVRVGPVQGNAEGNDLHITPACFVSVPFNYWTGSMEYRIQVVASGMHRGRLRIAWDPYHFDSEKLDVYNVNYSKVIDISECTDLTFKVGWGQETNYTTVPFMGDLPNYITSGSFSTPADGYNGVLGIFVVNSLTSPSDDANPVEINIFSRACDDFEVNTPTKLQTIQYEPNLNLVIPKAIPVTPARFYDGVPHRVLFRVDHPNNSDPILAKSIFGDQFYRYLSGISQQELLVYVPQGGNGIARATVTADANMTVKVSVQGGPYSSDIPVNFGVDNSIPIPYSDLAPGLHYISVNFDCSAAGLKVVEVSTKIPANWKPARTPATDLAVDSTIENIGIAGGFDFNRSNTAYTSSTLTLTGPTNFDVSAAPGSRYTLNLRDGGVLNGVTYVNDDGAEWDTNILYQCWGNVVPGEYPKIGDPGTRFNNPWLPIWGDIFWFQNDPDFPEGNCLRKQEPSFSVASENKAKAAQELADIIRSLESLSSTSEPQYVDHPEGDDVMAQSTSVDADNMNAPESQQVDTSMGPMTLPGANQVYFGEQVGSIRQILKRYEGDFRLRVLNAGQCILDLAQYPTLNVNDTTGTIKRLKHNSNLINWFLPAYVCVRGSMRIKVYGVAGTNTEWHPISASRISADEVVSAGVPIKAFGTQDDFRCLWSGTEFAHLGAQGEGTLEVELPWYSRYRFTPARSYANSDAENHVERDWLRLAVQSNAENHFLVAYATGEDFCLTHFLSTPIVKPTL